MVRLLLPLLTLLTAAKSPTVAESPSLAESQTPQAAVFIHCALLQRWQDVLDELVWAVHRGGLIAFVTNVVIVAVGADHATSDVRSELTPARYVSGGHERKIDIVFSNESMRRYELPTHTALQQFARSHPNHLLLYMHTKGVGKVINPAVEEHRKLMTYFNAQCFGACMDRLRAGSPSCGVDLVRQPELHFSGNFWWARADRIASLPEPNEFADIRRFPNALRSWRHNQEFWVTWREIASRPVCVWQSGIDVYKRHLTRYPPERYENATRCAAHVPMLNKRMSTG